MLSNTTIDGANNVVEYLTLEQISSLCSLSEFEVNELIEYGAIHFDKVEAQGGLVSTERIEALMEACRLRQDFDMDLFTVAVIIAYIETIETLEQQIREYKLLNQSINDR